MIKTLTCLLMLGLLYSCENEKPISDIVSTNETGGQEFKNDSLSVEDINRIINGSESLPWMSYSAILANGVERIYEFEADSNHQLICSLSNDGNLSQLKLYKQTLSKSKVDAKTTLTQKKYILVNDSSNCIVKSKQSTKYKAVVNLKRSISEDSTTKFKLDIYKKSL